MFTYIYIVYMNYNVYSTTFDANLYQEMCLNLAYPRELRSFGGEIF